MASYALTCCSTADLTHEHFAARDIQYVCFHFTLNGETYPDDLGQSIPFPIFYQAMANGAETSTSQVNISEYLDFFTPILESGKDILHVCLSSGLSGSYNSASSAALIAREQFPDRKIYIVDSLGASSGYGLIMETLADLRDEGMDIDTLHQWIEENKLRMNHWFFSTDLTFYVKGGRVSKAAGFIGGVLGICPLLNMDEQFPDRKIYIVDSLGASSGYGLIMETLADLRDEGMDIDTLHQWIEENKLRMNHWFFSTDLTFYVKGGRVSKAAGFIGGVLGICPLLNMDEQGHLIPRAKIRSKKKVIQEMLTRMEQYADNGLDYDGKCFISQSECYEDARALADLIEAKFPKLNGKVDINYVGTTIGSHTGPGTVALFFWGRDRKLPLL